MLKSTLIFLFLLLTTIPFSHGSTGSPQDAEQAGSLRDMTVQAMFEYGEKLYDRHDYREATHVFQHILFYDPQNTQALVYLNKMDPDFVAPRPIIVQVPAPKPMVVPVAAAVVGPTDPNADLKEEIAAQDKMIDELKEDIHRMRVELNS